MPKPHKKRVPWGDHVLKGRPQRTTAMPMKLAVRPTGIYTPKKTA